MSFWAFLFPSLSRPELHAPLDEARIETALTPADAAQIRRECDRLRSQRDAMRTRVEDLTGQLAVSSLKRATHLAGALFAVQAAEKDKQQAQTRVHELADQVQVLILRRALATELLQEIDTEQMPPEVAAQIRLACDALTRGGEEDE